ncbi:MAG: hypothetical protein KatS3mg109_1030 [Pirellulaceae bacterium]|nr:MAG: hypothetical protein KatS3mg109_1030 [Pirellulaceae bacterium]
MTYRLRFPFRSTYRVTDFNTPIALTARGIQASLEPDLPYLVLNLDGFTSESVAEEALPFAWGAVMLASVLSGWGFKAETTLGRVAYYEDTDQSAQNLHKNFGFPISGPVGFVSGSLPAVIPVDKNIRVATVLDVTIDQSIPASRIAHYLECALSHRDAGQLFLNERLKLALELWSDYHREFSLKAKFLTLVMALEVLAPPATKHSVALEVIDRWNEELTSKLQQCAEDPEEREAIESLQREILFRRERSIRSRIRKHILEVVGAVNHDNADLAAQNAVRAYDLRGRLLHTGTLSPTELSEGHTCALQALRTVLLASFGVSE